MLRILLVLVTGFSSVLLLWFVAKQNNSPGLSIGAALIGTPLFLTAFAIAKVTKEGVARDGKAAIVVAGGIALLAVLYVATFFKSWLLLAMVGLLLHAVAMLMTLLTRTDATGESETSVEE